MAGSWTHVLLLAALAWWNGPAFGQAPPALPNGATSLQETYQDWVVACGLTDAGKRCSFSQQQSQQNGQRVLAIELTAAADGAISGTLVLPFGLALAAGASLQVDDQPALPALAFSTCLPAGCLVPLSLSRDQVAQMRNGSQLRVNVRAEGSPQPTLFSISLKGLSAALDRTVALSR